MWEWFFFQFSLCFLSSCFCRFFNLFPPAIELSSKGNKTSLEIVPNLASLKLKMISLFLLFKTTYFNRACLANGKIFVIHFVSRVGVVVVVVVVRLVYDDGRHSCCSRPLDMHVLSGFLFLQRSAWLLVCLWLIK